MTSAVMEEFTTLCNTKQFLGAAFTPRHQGPGERKHIVVMQYWLILIHQICKAFPQEWDTLAPVVEYLLDTEIGECGFSAHELQTGYSLLQEPDVTLAPFLLPRGTAQTDIVAKLFSNFKELSGILTRHKERAAMRQEENVNQTRHLRQLIPGETVFRKMRSKARPAKHLLGAPSAGPYVVVRQSTYNSAQLRTHGVAIPFRAPRERALTINDNIIPWQLLERINGFHGASHGSHNTHGPVLMTYCAVINPNIGVSQHMVPVSHPLENLP